MRIGVTTHYPEFDKPIEPPQLPPPERSSLPTKLTRLKSELTTWVKSGMELVPKKVRQERLRACRECIYFNMHGNFGLGECKAPGCGCTKLKLALATSKCPHPAGSRWVN